MLARWGWTLFDLRKSVAEVNHKWNRIYDMQAANVSWGSVAEFLSAIQLRHLTDASFEQVFPSLANQAVVSELAQGVTWVNYNQPFRDLNALAASISLMPLVGGSSVLSVAEGNNKVCLGLVDRSGAFVHRNTRVSHVRAVEGQGFRLQFAEANSQVPTVFHAVVLAAPFETADIQLDAEIAQKIPKRQFQTTHVTNVRGRVDPRFFGLRLEAEVPGTVLFADRGAAPVSSFSTKGRFDDHTRLVTLFSPEMLNASVLETLFTEVVSVRRQVWQAYPRFSVPEKFAPTVLSENLFYLNGIESAASAIEISLIWARNIALLAAESIRGRTAPSLA